MSFFDFGSDQGQGGGEFGEEGLRFGAGDADVASPRREPVPSGRADRSSALPPRFDGGMPKRQVTGGIGSVRGQGGTESPGIRRRPPSRGEGPAAEGGLDSSTKRRRTGDVEQLPAPLRGPAPGAQVEGGVDGGRIAAQTHILDVAAAELEASVQDWAQATREQLIQTKMGALEKITARLADLGEIAAAELEMRALACELQQRLGAPIPSVCKEVEEACREAEKELAACQAQMEDMDKALAAAEVAPAQ